MITKADLVANIPKDVNLEQVLAKKDFVNDQLHLNQEKFKMLSKRLQIPHLLELSLEKYVGPNKDKESSFTNPNIVTTMTIRGIKVEQTRGAGEPLSSLQIVTSQKSVEQGSKPIIEREEKVHRENGKWNGDAEYWKKLYVGVLKEYQGFKAQSEFILQSNINAAEQKVLVLMEETEKTSQTLEKEKFSLTSTCRDLNREKIACETEIRTLRDELEETRRKLLCLEEKVTKECDFHPVKKIDESNFTASEQALVNYRSGSLGGLQNRLMAMDRKNQYLQYELEEANSRNDQLTEEIKITFSAQDNQVKDLKSLMNVYETQLHNERQEFEFKLAETRDVMDAQENYMKKIDLYLRERDETQSLAVERLSNYTAGLLDESNKTMIFLEQKLEKNQIQRKDVSSSLKKAVQVIQKLREQPIRFYKEIHDWSSQIYTLLHISSQNKIGPFNFDQNTSGYKTEKDILKNKDDETEIEIVLENTQKLLNDLLQALKFWKKENNAQVYQLKSRTIELEMNLTNDKQKLISELNSTREDCLKYRRWIRNIRRNFSKFQQKRQMKRTRVSRVDFTSTPLPRTNFGKKLRQKHCSSPMFLLSSKDIAQLQQKHAKFSKILEHVDKYISPEQEYPKKEKTVDCCLNESETY